MSKTLSSEDRLAVDLYLDRSQMAFAANEHTNHGAAAGAAFVSPEGVHPDRVHAAGRVLSLLKELPAVDPSSDLLTKTLRRIQQHIGAPAADSVSAPAATLDLPQAN